MRFIAFSRRGWPYFSLPLPNGMMNVLAGVTPLGAYKPINDYLVINATTQRDESERGTSNLPRLSADSLGITPYYSKWNESTGQEYWDLLRHDETLDVSFAQTAFTRRPVLLTTSAQSRQESDWPLPGEAGHLGWQFQQFSWHLSPWDKLQCIPYHINYSRHCGRRRMCRQQIIQCCNKNLFLPFWAQNNVIDPRPQIMGRPVVSQLSFRSTKSQQYLFS